MLSIENSSAQNTRKSIRSRIAFHTLGCKLNFSETSTMARDFVDKGFSIVKDFENADIHIINCYHEVIKHS